MSTLAQQLTLWALDVEAQGSIPDRTICRLHFDLDVLGRALYVIVSLFFRTRKFFKYLTGRCLRRLTTSLRMQLNEKWTPNPKKSSAIETLKYE